MVKAVTTPKAEPKGKKNDSVIKSKGSIQKKAKSAVSKMVQKMNSIAMTKVRNGEVSAEEEVRKKERNSRTLYIRFECKTLPKAVDDINPIHPKIEQVRVIRQGRKKKGIKYCFIEFPSEEDCEAAKGDLAHKPFNDGKLYADFVGEKSKNKGVKEEKKTKNKTPINPTCLFITGVPVKDKEAFTPEALKKLFPKAVEVSIPEISRAKGSRYGFVRFSTPADAKVVFDQSSDLEIKGHKLTLFYARMKRKASQKAEAKKRKFEAELETKEKAKKQKKVEEPSKEDDDDDEDDDEVEEVDEEEEDEGSEEDEVEAEESDDHDKDEDSDDDEDIENDVESESEDEDDD